MALCKHSWLDGFYDACRENTLIWFDQNWTTILYKQIFLNGVILCWRQVYCLLPWETLPTVLKLSLGAAAVRLWLPFLSLLDRHLQKHICVFMWRMHREQAPIVHFKESALWTGSAATGTSRGSGTPPWLMPHCAHLPSAPLSPHPPTSIPLCPPSLRPHTPQPPAPC